MHIAVITQAHVQQGRFGAMDINGYAQVRTCCPRTGHTNGGGVAVFARNYFSRFEEYSMAAREQDGIEHCAASVFPDRNVADLLVAMRIFRPPGKQRPTCGLALQRAPDGNRGSLRTTIIIGDRNLNSREIAGKGMLQQWLEAEQRWEPSIPEAPTFRAGGVLLAPGGYIPEAPSILEAEGGQRGCAEVYPVFVTPTKVSTDHYTLSLDLYTVEPMAMPKVEKCNFFMVREPRTVAYRGGGHFWSIFDSTRKRPFLMRPQPRGGGALS